MWAAASRRSYSFSYSLGLHEFLLESTCQRSACAEADAASRLAGTDSKRREGVGSIPALRFPRRGTPWLKLKRSKGRAYLGELILEADIGSH